MIRDDLSHGVPVRVNGDPTKGSTLRKYGGLSGRVAYANIREENNRGRRHVCGIDVAGRIVEIEQRFVRVIHD